MVMQHALTTYSYTIHRTRRTSTATIHPIDRSSCPWPRIHTRTHYHPLLPCAVWGRITGSRQWAGPPTHPHERPCKNGRSYVVRRTRRTLRRTPQMPWCGTRRTQVATGPACDIDIVVVPYQTDGAPDASRAPQKPTPRTDALTGLVSQASGIQTRSLQNGPGIAAQRLLKVAHHICRLVPPWNQMSRLLRDASSAASAIHGAYKGKHDHDVPSSLCSSQEMPGAAVPGSGLGAPCEWPCRSTHSVELEFFVELILCCARGNDLVLGEVASVHELYQP